MSSSSEAMRSSYMEKRRSATEARGQARVDRICVYGYVEHCAGQRGNEMVGKSKHTWIRKHQYATNTRIFCVARSEAKTPKLKALIPSEI